MSILVLVQHAEGVVPKGTLSTISAAQELRRVWGKGKLIGLALGAGAESAARAVAGCGFDEVCFCDAPSVLTYIAPAYAAAVLHVAGQKSCDAVVMPATSLGKDCAPRVAAGMDAGQASDIIGVNSDGTLRRPMYAGDVIADVEILSGHRVVTVRATAFAPVGASAPSAPVVAVDVGTLPLDQGDVVGVQVSGGERPELSDASVVVSGGRALGSHEAFEKVIFPLADAFGAAVGASRAAVDSGYAPNDWQVGQTGKIVAPTLYVAVGISGAIQHLAGMKDSKTIVAINKDGDAPIFEVADYGLVADLFAAAPQLAEAVKKAKGS